MKKNRVALSTFIVVLLLASLVSAQNPFITKPEDQHAPPAPAIKSKLLMKLLIWQHELKEKMTELVHQAKAGGSFQPLVLLLAAAFAYGVIHAVGPGHGKAIALSYVLSQRPSWFQGVLFSSSIALFHGVSGIILVLIIRLVLKQSVVRNLEYVTHTSQIISFSLVTCLGLWIFIKSIIKLKKNRGDGNQPYSDQKESNQYKGAILSAFVVGSIPCPAVVMVMLFALSMDLISLGIILGVTISVGMALTITIVVIMAISGKVASLSSVSKHSNLARVIESFIEIVAGLALMTLGLLLLGANI